LSRSAWATSRSSRAGPRTLAQLFGADPVIQNGFQTYPSEPWQSILLYGTFGMTLVFIVLALYFAATTEPPRAVYLVASADDNDEDEVDKRADAPRSG
jgi:hypothetical protein